MTYLAAVLADNPQHYWRLADPSGPVAHDIGSDPLLISSSPTKQPALGFSGIAADGGGAWFDSAQFFRIAMATKTLPSPGSFEAWVWPLSTPTGNLLVIADLWSSTVETVTYIDGVGFLHCNRGPLNINGTTLVTPQLWHHVVCTWDATTVRVYLDALLQASGALVLGAGLFRPNIGANDSQANQYGGCITEVAIYQQALNPTQINSHYLAKEYNGTPYYQGPSSYVTGTGGVSNQAADLAAIRAAVYFTGH